MTVMQWLIAQQSARSAAASAVVHIQVLYILGVMTAATQCMYCVDSIMSSILHHASWQFFLGSLNPGFCAIMLSQVRSHGYASLSVASPKVCCSLPLIARW